MTIHDWTRVDEGIFHAFHVNWTVELAKALNDRVLPRDYYALPEQIAGRTHPDLLTLHHEEAVRSVHGSPVRSGNGPRIAATVEEPSATQVMTMTAPTYDQLSRLISIRHVSGDEVVAIVELISWSNKKTLEALGMLVNKTCNALRQGIHVLAVDLYPPGPHDSRGLHPVIWESMGGEVPAEEAAGPLGAVSYEAIGRAEDSQQLRAFVEPLGVGGELPELPLFLRPGYHVPAPLQPTYETAFSSLPTRWRTVVER